jgi:hypothetical protein
VLRVARGWQPSLQMALDTPQKHLNKLNKHEQRLEQRRDNS